MSRKSTGSKRAAPEIGLFMECEDEELNPAQKEYYGKVRKDYQGFKKKMDDYLQKMKGEVIIEEGDCFLFQVKHRAALPATMPVVLDVENQSVLSNAPMRQVQTGRGTRHTIVPTAPALKTPATRGRRPGRPAVISHTPPASTAERGGRGARAANIQLPLQPVVVPSMAPPPIPVATSRKSVKPSAVPEKPTEATVLGGLAVGSRTARMASLIQGEGEADSREVMVGKPPCKTYPSLTIICRPYLQLKPSLVAQGQTERANLDVQVKGVLMYSATKFTEWLIQQGLVRSEQVCNIHVSSSGTPLPLKLGMYSDVTKFPYSGGYVWIADCCPSLLVSVFYGSIFEGAPHVPNVILKLMYHWACQTNVQNVTQWVKVDSLYVKTIYTLIRAICVLSVHQKYGLIGGRAHRVQVGVISLGTTSIDGATRQVKVEVLGVMDPETKLIRLRAVDPEGKQGKRRLTRMLQALPTWVDKESTIVVDATVDANVLHNVGFNRVEVTVSDGNKDIMEYLRKVVPRLFQNTLSLLSRPIIQQFLDELVWRERWGPIAAHAFNNLMAHLADLTRAQTEERVLKRLGAVAVDPFSLPESPRTHPANKPSLVVEETGKRGRKRQAENEAATPVIPPTKKPARSPAAKEPARPEVKENYWKVQPSDQNVSPEVSAFLSGSDKVAVEPYYYGTLQGDDSKIIDRKPAEVISIKCCICLKPFLDSLALMKHLLLHCQVKPLVSGPLRKIHQCSQCFLGFPSAATLRGHVGDVHTPPEHLKHLVCRICEKLFSDWTQFLYHMHRTHVAMELPYACEVCGFRSSSYSAVTEHITQAHRGGPHIFCPHCLKAVGLYRNNAPLPANVVFFVNHVQRHQRQRGAQCHRCRLSFVSTLLLQRHLENDHSSFLYNKNVRPVIATVNRGMPEPGNMIKPALLPQLSPMVRKPGMYSVRNFPIPVKLSGVDPRLACAECEGSLVSPDHFIGELRCSCCRYTSSCELAVVEHYTIYHDVNAPVAFSPGKPVMQATTMYCPCGFFSSSANTLARHMITCEKPTAYPNEAAARAALTAMGKGKKSTDGDEPTVLNMLGLVRKSPERTMEAGEISAELFPPKKLETVPSKREVVDLEMSDVEAAGGGASSGSGAAEGEASSGSGAAGGGASSGSGAAEGEAGNDSQLPATAASQPPSSMEVDLTDSNTTLKGDSSSTGGARPVAASSSPEVLELEKDAKKGKDAPDSVPPDTETPSAERAESADSSLEEKPLARSQSGVQTSPTGVAGPSSACQTSQTTPSRPVKEQPMDVEVENDAPVPEQQDAMDVAQKCPEASSSEKNEVRVDEAEQLPAENMGQLAHPKVESDTKEKKAERHEENVDESSKENVTKGCEVKVDLRAEQNVADRLEEEIDEIGEENVAERLEEEMDVRADENAGERAEKEIDVKAEGNVAERREEKVDVRAEESVPEKLEENASARPGENKDADPESEPAGNLVQALDEIIDFIDERFN